MVVSPALHELIPALIPRRHRGSRCLAISAGVLLAASSPALAQSPPAPQQAAPSDAPAVPREGDIYGHKEHQPTEAGVGEKEGPSGVDSPSAANRQEVDKQVDQLLRQTDELDEAAKKQGEDYPADASSRPPPPSSRSR